MPMAKRRKENNMNKTKKNMHNINICEINEIVTKRTKREET